MPGREKFASRLAILLRAAALKRMAAVDRRYWQLVDACRALVAADLPDEAKEAACLSVLRDHMGRIALSRYGCGDVQLRFYADMLVLRDQLFPRFATDDLGRLAIWPMFRRVNDWAESHRIHRIVR